MTLYAGDLIHRIDIEQPRYTQNTLTGERTVRWVPFASEVPARITALSAREFIAAQAVHSKVAARALMRYRAGISAVMRIKHRGLTYNIEGVLPDDESGLEWITLPLSTGMITDAVDVYTPPPLDPDLSYSVDSDQITSDNSVITVDAA